MATQLFIMPQSFDSKGRLMPSHVSALGAASWAFMPFGLELLGILATDPVDLSSFADTFAFPQNLDTTLSSADVANVKAFFATNNIPNSYIVAGMTWRTVAQTTAKCFQIAQRHNGLTGSAIFSTTTQVSLAAQSSAIVASTIAPPAPIRVGTVPTLSGSLSSLSTVNTNLTTVAGSFGFTSPDPNGTLEAALISLANQFQAQLVMDRGDGFHL
jgi:hypothetical protein